MPEAVTVGLDFVADDSRVGFRLERLEVLNWGTFDQRVWRPNPQFFSYSLSKAGLWWATQTLAQALAPRVRVAHRLRQALAVAAPQSTPEWA